MMEFVYFAMVDKYIFEMAVNMMNNEPAVASYRILYEARINEACQRLVGFLLDVRGVIDFDIMMILEELTTAVRSRAQFQLGCSVQTVHAILCTVCNRIHDRGVTPFVATFVDALFQAREQVQATGKYRKFVFEDEISSSKT